MSKKITIVWVPGAWHDPDAFFEVGNVLEKHGYTNVYVNTASVGSTKPLDDPFEDTKIVRKHILKALDEDGHDVVLAMHSYGGVPGTNAAHGLGKKQREAEGSKTGVINLAYIAAFCLPKGVSLFMALDNKPLPWFIMKEGHILPDNPEHIFYNDCTEGQQTQWKLALKPHAMNVFTDQVFQHETYKEIPSSYLVCKQDNAIPLENQRKMIEGAGPEAFQIVEELDASHSPFLSKVQETAAFLRRVAGENPSDFTEPSHWVLSRHPTFETSQQTTTSDKNVTVIWVPGAYHGPEGFEEVGGELERHGYKNVYIKTPSTGVTRPLEDPYEDGRVIRDKILEVLDGDRGGRDAVLVMHSYAGVPGTNAAAGLGKDERRMREGRESSGIVNLVYISACVVPQGATLLDAVGGVLPSWIEDKEGCLVAHESEHIFYNDCTRAQQARLKSALLTQSANTFSEQVLQHETYTKIPSSYLVCLRDNAFPVEVQREMIAQAGPEAFRLVEEIDSSHSPFVSRVQETARFIRRAAREEC